MHLVLNILLKNESKPIWNKKLLFNQAIGVHFLGCTWPFYWKNTFWIQKKKLIHPNVFNKDPTYGHL